METWEAIVRRLSPLVWRTAFRLLRNEADAADCLQEVFLSAWRLSRSQTIDNWGGLLHHLATARALDQLRRRKRERMHRAAADVSNIASAGTTPLQSAQESELADELRELLAELPAAQSEVYCLRHLDGLTYEQIAAELKITVNAVGVTLHRATQRLAAALPPAMLDRSE